MILLILVAEIGWTGLRIDFLMNSEVSSLTLSDCFFRLSLWRQKRVWWHSRYWLVQRHVSFIISIIHWHTFKCIGLVNYHLLGFADHQRIMEKSNITYGMYIKVVLILSINMPHKAMVYWHHSILTMSPDPFFRPPQTNEKSGLATQYYEVSHLMAHVIKSREIGFLHDLKVAFNNRLDLKSSLIVTIT